jgi:hypothetical protein
MPERAEIHSLVVTGNEPNGGITMVIDRGEGVEGRFLCVEIPQALLAGFIEAPQKAAADMAPKTTH